MFNLLSERMQADAEEIIILPESGLALACFKRRAQVSDPKLGTPIIKSSSFPLLLLGNWTFLSKENMLVWASETYANAYTACATHLACKAWLLFTASIASACSAQCLSILRPIYNKAARHPTIAATSSPIHSPQGYVYSRPVLALSPCLWYY